MVLFIHMDYLVVPLACYRAKTARIDPGRECLRQLPSGASLFVEVLGPTPSQPKTAELYDARLAGLTIAPKHQPVPGYSVWPPEAAPRVHRIATDPDMPVDPMFCKGCELSVPVPIGPSPSLRPEEVALLTQAARRLHPGAPERKLSITQTVDMDLDRDGKPDRLISAFLQTPSGPSPSSEDAKALYEESTEDGSIFLLSSRDPQRVQTFYPRGHTILATIDFSGDGEVAVLLENHDRENVRYYLLKKEQAGVRELACLSLGPGPGVRTDC